MELPSLVPVHAGADELGPTTYTLVPAVTELVLMLVAPNEAVNAVDGPIPDVGDHDIVGV